MRTSVVGSAMVVGRSATVSPSPGCAVDAGTYETSFESGMYWPGTLAVDVAGNAIAVGDNSFRNRHVNGRWSQEYHLPGRPLQRGDGRSGSGRNGGCGRVLGYGRGLAATIRRTDATWPTPYVLNTGLRGLIRGVDVVATAAGDYAVSWTQLAAAGHTAYVAVRQRGGTWHRYVMGAIGDGPTRRRRSRCRMPGTMSVRSSRSSSAPVDAPQAFNPTAGTPVTIADAPTDPAFTGGAINRYDVAVLAAGTHDNGFPARRRSPR